MWANRKEMSGMLSGSNNVWNNIGGTLGKTNQEEPIPNKIVINSWFGEFIVYIDAINT